MTAPEPLLGAHVSGWSAFVLDAILRVHGAPYLRVMDPDQRRQIQRTAEALDRAALYWQEQQGCPTCANASAQVAEDQSARPSWNDELSVPEAAGVLGVSPQRVRQLAVGWSAEGLARKVGRSWLVDAAAVALHRENMRRPAA